MIKSKLSLR